MFVKKIRCPACKKSDYRSADTKNFVCNSCGRYFRKGPAKKIGRPVKAMPEVKLSGVVTHARMAKSKYDAPFPEIPGDTKAQKCISFIETYCVHHRGKWTGQPFILRDWQKGIITDLFNGKIKKAYISMARKNGKSLLIACIGLFLLVYNDEAGKEIYTAASSHEQATLIFEMAAFSIHSNPTLSASLKVLPSIKKVIYLAANSFLRAISSESKSAHGFNSYAVICDELHVWPDRDLFDVLETSFGVRDNPLMISITTSGFDKLSLCRELYDYGRQVQSGVVDDPTFYFKCFELDEKDDWKDEKNWIKANPGLGDFRLLLEMQELFKKASVLPSFENTFKRLYLNQWTSSNVRWLPLELWDRCNEVVDRDKIKGRSCYAAFDLSSTTALTSLSLLFPPLSPEDKFDLLSFFWMPDDALDEREKLDKVPYRLWAKQGLIYTCPGRIVDYNFMKQKLQELAVEFKLEEIGYDPWNASSFASDLEAEGFKMVEIRQGFQSLSEPSKELEKMILAEKLRHGNNPVLRWMADSVVVKMDPAGNIKPDKDKSLTRIDGIVSLVMSIDRHLRHPQDQKFIYQPSSISSLRAESNVEENETEVQTSAKKEDKILCLRCENDTEGKPFCPVCGQRVVIERAA